MSTAKKAAAPKKAAATKEKAAKKLSIMERVNSYEDACAIEGNEPATLEQFSFLPETDRQYLFSMLKVTTVIRVLKEGKPFDWNKFKEKFVAWWDMQDYPGDEAGSGFRFCDSDYDFTLTFVGGRLSMPERAHVAHVAKIMFEDFKIIMKG